MNKPPRPLPVAKQLPEEEPEIVTGEPVVETPVATKKNGIAVVAIVVGVFALLGAGGLIIVLSGVFTSGGSSGVNSKIDPSASLVTQIRAEIATLEGETKTAQNEERRLEDELRDAENEALAVEAKNQSLQNELDSILN